MNLLYVVASNKDYFENTRSPFLATVPKNKKNSFIFVVNGSDVEKEEIVDGVRVRYVLDNSYEYSPLIDLVNHPNAYNADYIFLLEDTCSLGKNFFKFTDEPDKKFDSIAVNSLERNIGWLKKDFLLSKKSFILSMKNCSLEDRLNNKGKIFRISNSKSSFPRNMKILSRKRLTGIGSRLVEYYVSVDLYKYRASVKEGDRYVEE